MGKHKSLDTNSLSYEALVNVLNRIIKEGFKPIPTKKRVKMLEEQRRRIEESEKCFKTDRKQLERQFTL